MKIPDKDFYHGAALTQIVEHPSFKALNKGSARYGHYLVNADCHLFVRYRTNEESPWSFTFTPEQLEAIANIQESSARVFVSLVCGGATVCLINEQQIGELLDFENGEQQWMRVDVPDGGGCRVSSTNGQLSKVVPHNAFPDRLFDSEQC